MLRGAAGLYVASDAPVFWVRASGSVRGFWARFHVSWWALFVRAIWLPLGGGHAALTAVVAFATLLHGFHAHWAAWGALNLVALTAERVLARPARAPLARAVNQAATLLTMLALVGGMSGGGPNCGGALAATAARTARDAAPYVAALALAESLRRGGAE